MASKKRKKKSRRWAAGRSAQPTMSAVILELADPLLKQHAFRFTGQRSDRRQTTVDQL